MYFKANGLSAAIVHDNLGLAGVFIWFARRTCEPALYIRIRFLY